MPSLSAAVAAIVTSDPATNLEPFGTVSSTCGGVLPSGPGVGDGDGLGVGVGDAVGVDVGVGDGDGVAVGDGDAVGVGVTVGVGVGVGSGVSGAVPCCAALSAAMSQPRSLPSVPADL